MEIKEAVAQLRSFSLEGVICARRPWSATAECIVVQTDDDGRIPPDVEARGFEYFLEIEDGLHVLESLAGTDLAEDIDARTRLVIHYAETDAFPDWAHLP